MSKREIDGLLWARRCERPGCIPVGRPRGAKAEGLRFERAFQKAVGDGVAGQWFEFNDSNGLGYCQTDHLILRLNEKFVYVFECKLSWTEDGRDNLEGLYLPVARKAFDGFEVRGIVVCESLKRGMPWTSKIVSSLEEALAASYWPSPVILHWKRKTPLSRKPSVRKPVGERDAA